MTRDYCRITADYSWIITSYYWVTAVLMQITASLLHITTWKALITAKQQRDYYRITTFKNPLLLITTVVIVPFLPSTTVVMDSLLPITTAAMDPLLQVHHERNLQQWIHYYKLRLCATSRCWLKSIITAADKYCFLVYVQQWQDWGGLNVCSRSCRFRCH
jgi:hypothetical protein